MPLKCSNWVTVINLKPFPPFLEVLLLIDIGYQQHLKSAQLVMLMDTNANVGSILILVLCPFGFTPYCAQAQPLWIYG